MSKRRCQAVTAKMSDGRQALKEFWEQPRSRAVWRLVIEPISILPRTVLVTVDPEAAREWLKCRVSPAEPDPVRASQYAKIMAVGLWQPRDDEPIELKVSDVGLATVTDGQHRLAAVLIAAQPVELLVRFC
jgi:hypothetical protein